MRSRTGNGTFTAPTEAICSGTTVVPFCARKAVISTSIATCAGVVPDDCVTFLRAEPIEKTSGVGDGVIRQPHLFGGPKRTVKRQPARELGRIRHRSSSRFNFALSK